MININIEPALLLGAVFALVMLFLYGLRFVNPDLATDWDIFITTLGIVYSSIILIHGWRLDPILLFSQVLLIFITFSFLLDTYSSTRNYSTFDRRYLIKFLINFFSPIILFQVSRLKKSFPLNCN